MSKPAHAIPEWPEYRVTYYCGTYIARTRFHGKVLRVSATMGPEHAKRALIAKVAKQNVNEVLK